MTMARDKIQFVLNGASMSLTPDFDTLSKVEQVLGRSAVQLLQQASVSITDIAVTDFAKLIFHGARPEGAAQYPDWWTLKGVGQAILDQGFKQFFPVLLGFLTSAITARSEVVPTQTGNQNPGN